MNSTTTPIRYWHEVLISCLVIYFTITTVTANDQTPFIYKTSISHGKGESGEFKLVETTRKVEGDSTHLVYTPLLSGFPKDKIYQLLIDKPGARWSVVGDRVNGAEYIINDKNELQSTLTGKPIGEIYINQFVTGEFNDFALKSTDDKIVSIFRLIPFPLESTEGNCRLAMLITNVNAETYAIEGYGFEANETISVELSDDEKLTKALLTVDGDGRIKDFVTLNHGSKSVQNPSWIILEQLHSGLFEKSGGEATVKIAGRSCAPTIHYNWGTEANKFR